MDAQTPVVVAQAKPRGDFFAVVTTAAQQVRLPAEVVLKHGIFPGHQFLPEEWEQVLRDAEDYHCYRRLLGLLARRAYAETEMRRKLSQRGFPPRAVHRAVDQARSLKLLDDAAVARAYAEEKLKGGGVGRMRVAAALSRRGVARTVITEALDASNGPAARDEEFAAALETGRRKWATMTHEPDVRRKRARLVRFLAGRGFPAGTCFDVARALAADVDDVDDAPPTGAGD